MFSSLYSLAVACAFSSSLVHSAHIPHRLERRDVCVNPATIVVVQNQIIQYTVAINTYIAQNTTITVNQDITISISNAPTTLDTVVTATTTSTQTITQTNTVTATT